ncbi:MAG: diacylglycerol kinase, partial [Bacteroidetes bacterium]|nr:diacylglycerol kinase [Bacteroidota bacterium]
LNTIIERYADFISKDADSRVKMIKDLSAGAVLLSAVAAAVVGLIILLPVVIPAAGFYFLKFKERNIINVDTCIKAGYPVVKISNTMSECRTFTGKKFSWADYTPPKEETDEEIIENYKSGKFTVIGSEINPYNQRYELIILTFHDYNKFNEPAPHWCGEHSINCYILLKTNDNVSVIAKVYSASFSYWNKGLKADFITGKINNIPLINFLDKENAVLRSGDTLSGPASFFKINLNTKEINSY